MARACSWRTRALISGYMMGSPTSDSAQCRGWRRQPHISAFASQDQCHMQKVTVGCHLNWASHSRFTDAEQMKRSLQAVVLLWGTGKAAGANAFSLHCIRAVPACPQPGGLA